MPTQPDPNRWNLNKNLQNGASAPAPGGEQQGSPARLPAHFEKAKRMDATYDDEDDGRTVHFLF